MYCVERVTVSIEKKKKEPAITKRNSLSTMSAVALVLLIIVMFIVLVAACFRTGYLEKKEEVEDRRLRMRMREEQVEAALTAKNNAELRARIVERLFPSTGGSFQSQEGGENGSDNMDERRISDSGKSKRDDSKCAICLEPFFDGGDSSNFDVAENKSDSNLSKSKPLDIVQGSACPHRYHRRCVVSWLMNTSHCPECRQPMWTDEAYQLARQEVLATNAATATSFLASSQTSDACQMTSSFEQPSTSNIPTEDPIINV